MKIAIFGGAGFIGTNIALEAEDRGWDTVLFDNLVRKDSEQNLYKAKGEYIRGDIRLPHDFERLPKDIDAIINLAANPGIPWSIQWPTYDFSVNAGGALNVLEYARHHGKIPVIFASTNKIYSDEVNTLPLHEEETRFVWDDKSYKGIPETFPMDGRGTYPHSPYGVSKCSADLYHQEYFHVYGVPTVINRMSCIYGYYQKGVEDQGWIYHFVKTIAAGDGKLNIYGNGKQVRDMLFGTDVAKLYLDQLEGIDTYKGLVFNVGGGIDNTISLLESIALIEARTQKKAILTFHPERVADQRIYVSDISKVMETTHWKPTITPYEGIQKLIDTFI